LPPHSLPDLEALRIDAFLVSSLHNVRYLSGFTGSNALLLIGRGAATLYTDPRYDIQAAQECSCRTKVVKGSLYTAALDEIRRRRFRRIGFERNNIGYGAYAMLEDGIPAGAKLIAIGGFIERLRMVKSAEEIDLIRRSVDVNSRAYDRAMARIKPSISESDLAAELEYQMRRNGAEKPAFETIVAGGPRSALPHAQPSSARLETGRLLLIDMGAVLGGYSSDMTRMAHLGKPAPKTRRLYNAVLEAQLAALNTVRPGVTADRVDRAARNALKRHGMDKFFVHSTGHGLGLEIHEPPRLGRREKTLLEAGMTITIEPGAYLEGFGGVRIEDTVLVTKTGCEVLTPTGKELMQL
jgi:Xaa-Pro aminopeptidase